MRSDGVGDLFEIEPRADKTPRLAGGGRLMWITVRLIPPLCALLCAAITVCVSRLWANAEKRACVLARAAVVGFAVEETWREPWHRGHIVHVEGKWRDESFILMRFFHASCGTPDSWVQVRRARVPDGVVIWYPQAPRELEEFVEAYLETSRPFED